MEIEKKAFISNLKEFKSTISNLGAIKLKNTHVIDYWFCKKEFTKFEQVEQNAQGSYLLRVRKIITPLKTEWELNSAILDKEGDHNSVGEIKTKIFDGEATLKILESMGLKVFCTLDKEREIYSLKNITINIDNIKNFKPSVELEILADKNILDKKEKLDNLVIKLKLKKEDLIDKSITSLYIKEFSFK
jgi:predicted adenylyl cyclase CyaB